MNELQYLFALICSRRNAQLKRVENVAFANAMPWFGLSNGGNILAAVADTFYYVRTLSFSTQVTQDAATRLQFTGIGPGGAGTCYITTPLAAGQSIVVGGLECASIIYNANGRTTGTVAMFGEVYKVTYETNP